MKGNEYKPDYKKCCQTRIEENEKAMREDLKNHKECEETEKELIVVQKRIEENEAEIRELNTQISEEETKIAELNAWLAEEENNCCIITAAAERVNITYSYFHDCRPDRGGEGDI